MTKKLKRKTEELDDRNNGDNEILRACPEGGMYTRIALVLGGAILGLLRNDEDITSDTIIEFIQNSDYLEVDSEDEIDNYGFEHELALAFLRKKLKI